MLLWTEQGEYLVGVDMAKKALQPITIFVFNRDGQLVQSHEPNCAMNVHANAHYNSFCFDDISHEVFLKLSNRMRASYHDNQVNFCVGQQCIDIHLNQKEPVQ